MTTRQKQLVMAVIVPVQIISAVLAWKDMARRSDRQIRGNKRWWRVFVSINPGNSLLYWLFGRR